MNNYELSRDRAQSYFLRFDQQKLIEKWKLKCDEALIYIRFLGEDYTLCRQNGVVSRNGQVAGFEETLSIFDLLCHQGQKPLTGVYAPVNSLKGRPAGAGVNTDFTSKTATYFDQHFAQFCESCEALGGTPVPMGDAAYRFTVFEQLTLILKFYRADEDFPASLVILWEDETLSYLLYETVFYVQGYLLSRIAKKMEE